MYWPTFRLWCSVCYLTNVLPSVFSVSAYAWSYSEFEHQHTFFLRFHGFRWHDTRFGFINWQHKLGVSTLNDQFPATALHIFLPCDIYHKAHVPYSRTSKRLATWTSVFFHLSRNLVCTTRLVCHIKSTHTHTTPISLYSNWSVLLVTLLNWLHGFISRHQQWTKYVYTTISHPCTYLKWTEIKPVSLWQPTQKISLMCALNGNMSA